MWRFNIQKLLWIMILVLKKIIGSIVIVFVLIYVVLVFDIYINTEKLNKVNHTLNIYCEDITRNPQFTKGRVVFRVDRGTLVYRLYSYVSRGEVYGYAPFFIFPHHRTIIINEKVINSEYLDVLIAHELGHIQGGLEFWGKVRNMEKYANSFAIEIVGSERFKSFDKYLEELSKKEPLK